MKRRLRKKQQKRIKRAKIKNQQKNEKKNRMKIFLKSQHERISMHAKVEEAKASLKEKGEPVTPETKADELEGFLRNALKIPESQKLSLEELWSLAEKQKLDITRYLTRDKLIKQGILS